MSIYQGDTKIAGAINFGNKANIDSPALTGVPTAPTTATGTNTTQLATTAFVNAEIANDAPTKTGSGASGSWGISVTGNAATATKLAAAKNITLTGDVTGTVRADLSGDINIATTIADDSHNHIISNIDGLQTALDGKAATTGITSGSWQIGEKIFNVAHCMFGSTPTEILIYTKIPFISGSHMPVIHIEGYAYGLNSPIEIKIGYYVYGDAHGWCGAVSMGAWQPTIKLFSYIGADEVKYTGVALIGSIYFPQFAVHVQTEMGGNYPDGWIITSNMEDNTIYHMPDTDVVTVPYKPTFSRTLSLTGDVTGSATFNGVSDASITAIVADDSHNHVIENVDNLQTVLDSKIGIYAGTEAPTNTKQLWVDTDDESAAVGQKVTVLSVTIPAVAWISGVCTFSNSNITLDSIITISPASTTTLAQYDAIAGAKIIENSISAGQVVLKALGTAPTIDCPVVIVIEG